VRHPARNKSSRMASYHFSVHSPVSRGKGQSLVRTAAYNDRARLVDERTGEVWDYRHLGAALASGIYAPKDAPDWARDLGQLVNEVERFEKRSDAQLAMNLDIALPHEQTLEQNRRLMQDFVREQFQRKSYAAHFAIHPPDRDGDERNIHAHVLVTLRKIDEHGFARTKAEQQENYRNRSEYTEYLRDAWEKLANRHLERNGYDARIDRRSLEDQGIEREPEQHRGPAVTAMEREGNVTRIGDEIRRRQGHYAELKALGAEERQIDAQIIDLQAARAEREARAAARGRTDEIRPDRSAELDHQAEQAMQDAHTAAKGRVDDIRPDTASRDFSAAETARGQESTAANRHTRERPEPTPPPKVPPEFAREAVGAHEAPAAASAPEPAQTPSQTAEQARPASWIENRIEDCATRVRISMTFTHRDGAEVFPARLAAETGMAIARVTETDVKELAALREQEGFARASGLSYKPHHLAADLVAGDLAAVTRFGDVHRINPDKVGDAKQYIAADLPGVIETRARFEIEREQTSALWDRRRTDAAARRQDFAAERESRHQAAETARDVHQFNQDVGAAVDTGFKASGGFLRGLASVVGKFFDFLGDMIAPPPPPTRDQAERMVRAAEENQQERAAETAQTERAEAQYWLIEEARRRAAEREAGRSPESERPRDRDDDDYGRERERDRGYER
jgi:MobA/MobL family